MMEFTDEDVLVKSNVMLPNPRRETKDKYLCLNIALLLFELPNKILVRSAFFLLIL